MKAELQFTNFLIEHNLPLATADHAGPLFRATFPDSKIAKNAPVLEQRLHFST